MRVVTTYKDKPLLFRWVSFSQWESCRGWFFIRERVYRDGYKWTPFVKVYLRRECPLMRFNNVKVTQNESSDL